MVFIYGLMCILFLLALIHKFITDKPDDQPIAPPKFFNVENTEQVQKPSTSDLSREGYYNIWCEAYYEGYHAKCDESKGISSTGKCVTTFNEWWNKKTI